MTDGQTDSIVRVLRQLSEILDTDEGEPTTALRKMADLVRDHTQSHGAKVFVVKRTPGGPGIEQLCRTDLDTPKRKTLLLSAERGLADWVVHNNDWLIIPDAPGSEDGAEESIVEVITGKHGYQEIVPRKEKEYYDKQPCDQEPPKDDERTMLWVPIYSQGKPAGALAVWRKEIPSSEFEPPPYEEADANSLHQIVPYIGFAVRRLLHLETLQRELDAVSSFAKALHSADSLEDAYRAVAHGLGGLAIASHVILLYHDPDRPGYVYHRAVWNADEHSKAAVCNALEGFYTQAHVDDPEWKAMVSQPIDVRLRRAGVADFHCRRLLTLMNEEESAPTVTAALIDRRLADNHPEFFANDLLEHSADSFFRYAGSLLPDHIQTFSHKIADRIGGTDESPLLEPDHVLKRSAELLKEATNASAVLLYTGPPDEMKVVHCTPEVSELIGFSTETRSLTWNSIQTLQRRRLVNVEDDRERFHSLIDEQALKHIRYAYGWKIARSWLGCPIIHNQRCIAFLSVLTANSGTFIGKDHERIAETVCDRTGWEFQKANRRYMLEKLNELAKDLTACSRDDLKIKMVEVLQQWTNRFVKPHSNIVVVARSTLENMPEKMLLKAASPGIDQRQLDLLSNLSKVWQHDERDWPVKAVFPNASAERRKETLNLAGIAVPVSLPKKARLQGHLCMLNRQPFHEDERQAARDAAREIAVILYTLQLDTEWRLASGRLRHRLLGPVQGLSSAALFLAELATSHFKIGTAHAKLGA